tara:strand:- start:27006 stop:27908 length:903 start_codon:yes stop_codon:yes gene_type:complete
MKYHVPVLLNESVNGLSIKPEGTYVDLTFGGGGHSSLILDKLNVKGKLFSFDKDDSAIKENKFKNVNFQLIKSDFKFFDLHIRDRGIEKVDGILADLGVSSHQIDNKKRGFSYLGNGVLDMRMSTDSELSAEEVLNTYDQDSLQNILFNYGDIKNSKIIAQEIISYRNKKRIINNEDLLMAIKNISKKKLSYKFLSKLYQAIRIEVNDEISSLREMLKKSVDFLKKSGRLVIISYHSIEDRLVKNFINKSSFNSDFKKDLYGKKIEFFKRINKKPIVPPIEEIAFNSRSRSAKLRIGERI